MMTAVLAWLYGQVLIGTLVSASAWIPVALRRWRDPARPPIGNDAYRWIATGNAMVLLGIASGTLSRVATAAITGDGGAGRVPLGVVVSLLLLMLGSAALVWGSTIDRSPRAWRWFVALSVLWLLGTLIWRL